MRDPVLEQLYRERPCLICHQRGFCPHREPRVDRAEIEAKQIKDPKV